MGCKCANSNNEEYEINNKKALDDNKLHYLFNDYEKYNNNNNYDENYENVNNQEYSDLNNQENIKKLIYDLDENIYIMKYLNYPEKIVEIINAIRQDPPSYSKIIEDSIKNIVENKGDFIKNKIIYKQEVKVALKRGEPSFREAAEELRNTNPLPPLKFCPELCIPLPDNEEQMKDSQFLIGKVFELKREEGIFIDVFFQDLVKIPEVSALLMIVDDNERKARKKRKTLLNKDFKYIGVNCKFIGRTFIAYFGFSK